VWCVCNSLATTLLFQKCMNIIYWIDVKWQSQYKKGTGHIHHTHRGTFINIQRLCVSCWHDFLAIMFMSAYVYSVLNLHTRVKWTRSNELASLSVRILRDERNVAISTVIACIPAQFFVNPNISKKPIEEWFHFLANANSTTSRCSTGQLKSVFMNSWWAVMM
jgi:hypothetical protein